MKTLSYQHVFSPASDASAPPLLLLHGTGGNEHDLLSLGKTLSPGSALLSPLGDVNEHGQARFFRRFAEGVFDLEDVAKRTVALADFIAAAGSAYAFDTSRLIAIGFSNGANIAACLMQLCPTALANAILLRPMVVLPAPAKMDSLRGKSVLISSGNRDPIVPLDQPAQLAELLRAGGAVVKVHLHAAGHGLAPDDVKQARAFLRDLV